MAKADSTVTVLSERSDAQNPRVTICHLAERIRSAQCLAPLLARNTDCYAEVGPLLDRLLGEAYALAVQLDVSECIAPRDAGLMAAIEGLAKNVETLNSRVSG